MAICDIIFAICGMNQAILDVLSAILKTQPAHLAEKTARMKFKTERMGFIPVRYFNSRKTKSVCGDKTRQESLLDYKLTAASLKVAKTDLRWSNTKGSRSTDGGKNWELVFDLKPIYGEDANIMGITCIDDYVVCVG